jgi:hypothetical protein
MYNLYYVSEIDDLGIHVDTIHRDRGRKQPMMALNAAITFMAGFHGLRENF